jgi:hypothetical protein
MTEMTITISQLEFMAHKRLDAQIKVDVPVAQFK